MYAFLLPNNIPLRGSSMIFFYALALMAMKPALPSIQDGFSCELITICQMCLGKAPLLLHSVLLKLTLLNVRKDPTHSLIISICVQCFLSILLNNPCLTENLKAQFSISNVIKTVFLNLDVKGLCQVLLTIRTPVNILGIHPWIHVS